MSINLYFVKESTEFEGATLNDFLSLCDSCVTNRREAGDEISEPHEPTDFCDDCGLTNDV